MNLLSFKRLIFLFFSVAFGQLSQAGIPADEILCNSDSKLTYIEIQLSHNEDGTDAGGGTYNFFSLRQGAPVSKEYVVGSRNYNDPKITFVDFPDNAMVSGMVRPNDGVIAVVISGQNSKDTFTSGLYAIPSTIVKKDVGGFSFRARYVGPRPSKAVNPLELQCTIGIGIL